MQAVQNSSSSAANVGIEAGRCASILSNPRYTGRQVWNDQSAT
jgi:hypothetical protein